MDIGHAQNIADVRKHGRRTRVHFHRFVEFVFDRINIGKRGRVHDHVNVGSDRGGHGLGIEVEPFDGL